MAVLAPMPSARAKTAISVKAGFFSSVRMANRLFWPMPGNTLRIRWSSRKMVDWGRTVDSLPHVGNAWATYFARPPSRWRRHRPSWPGGLSYPLLIRREIEDVGAGAHHQVAEAEHLALGGEEDGAVGGFAWHQLGLDQGQRAGCRRRLQLHRPHGEDALPPLLVAVGGFQVLIPIDRILVAGDQFDDVAATAFLLQHLDHDARGAGADHGAVQTDIGEILGPDDVRCLGAVGNRHLENRVIVQALRQRGEHDGHTGFRKCLIFKTIRFEFDDLGVAAPCPQPERHGTCPQKPVHETILRYGRSPVEKEKYPSLTVGAP